MRITGPLQRIEPLPEQAELVAFGIGEHVPALVAGLADVRRRGA
jgi:hypothetical protein